TQERVKKILDDLAVLHSAGQFHLLKDPRVLADLQASEDQKDLIRELIDTQDEQRKAMNRELPDLTAAQKRQWLIGQAPTKDAQIKGILTAKQLYRLEQIALQYRGPAAFHD